MWYLEVFDGASELQVREYSMHGLNTATLKKILDLGDTAEIGGVKYPLEAGGFDIPPEILPIFTGYIDETFTVDDSWDYQVGFYDE